MINFILPERTSSGDVGCIRSRTRNPTTLLHNACPAAFMVCHMLYHLPVTTNDSSTGQPHVVVHVLNLAVLAVQPDPATAHPKRQTLHNQIQET
jgi:hypothetical protein